MRVTKCSVCGKPIIGYWVTIKKMGDNRDFCVPCAQSTSIWDLVVEGIFGIQPDIAVEIDGDKQVLSSSYGLTIDENYNIIGTDSATEENSEDGA